MLSTKLHKGSHLHYYTGIFHWEDVRNIPLKLQGKFYFYFNYSLPEQQGYGFLLICKKNWNSVKVQQHVGLI